MLNGLTGKNKHVAHTLWMSNCLDVLREDVLFAGHCGAVAGVLLSNAAYSDNTGFIKDGAETRSSDSAPGV